MALITMPFSHWYVLRKLIAVIILKKLHPCSLLLMVSSTKNTIETTIANQEWCHWNDNDDWHHNDITSSSSSIPPVFSPLPHVLLLSLNSTTSLQQKDDLDKPGHLFINSPTAAQWHAANNHCMTALPLASPLSLCLPLLMPSYSPSPTLLQIQQQLCCSL